MTSFYSTAVFLGLSLKKEQASQILAANYYPPAQKGDIYRIVATGVEKIILIDGFIYSKRPVWQRELLDAIDRGIEVWGASGVGALRALELQAFGMKSSGTIFEWYRDGMIEGDDEVATQYGMEGNNFFRLSEPLVNIRYTLINAVKDKYLTTEQAEELMIYAKKIYYPNRSYNRLLKSPVLAVLPSLDLAKIEKYFLSQSFDLQKIDAVQILSEQAKSLNHSKTPTHATFSPPTLEIQIKRLTMTGFIVDENIANGDRLWQVVSQDTALLNQMYSTLSKHSFIWQWAIQNNISLPDCKLQEYAAEWEKKYNIVSPEKWLRANGLTLSHYQALLEKRCLVNWIIRQGPPYFGLEWKWEVWLNFEYYISGPERRNLNLSEVPPASYQSVWNPELKQLWNKLSQRGFILEWARQNGVVYPENKGEKYTEIADREQGIIKRHAWQDKNYACSNYYREFLLEKAWELWMVEKGINYFGIAWNFPLALLEELQITGQATQILKHHYGKS